MSVQTGRFFTLSPNTAVTLKSDKHQRLPFKQTTAIALVLALGCSITNAADSDHIIVAQETEPPSAQVDETTPAPAAPADDAVEASERIVVTGSRIKRDEFNTPTPLQVISGAESREAGLVNTADILQRTTVATSAQADLSTNNSYVGLNGPGSSSIGLRGLDEPRTLVMVNGRRLAPAGVEGAPISADLNLVPAALIDRIEILLDGASSVYGSDAVAGVVNIILKTDFDGFEIEGFQNMGPYSSGRTSSISGTWGVSSDRGSLGFAAEYFDRDRLVLNDRPFGERCDENREVDLNTGQTYNEDATFGGTCGIFDATGPGIINRIQVFTPGGFVSRYYTPGAGTVAPDYSPAAAVAGGINTAFYHGYPENRDSDLVGGLRKYTFYGYGDYNLGVWDNLTAFFEASLSNRFSEEEDQGSPIFPDVPADNPFNPTNTAYHTWTQAATANSLVRPLILIDGDRNNVESDVTQIRFIGGLEGDLSVLDDLLGLPNWTWEASVALNRSTGTSSRPGIRGDLLSFSLFTTADADANPANGIQAICGIDFDGDGIPDSTATPPTPGVTTALPCVPVNLFAPNVYNNHQLTPEESAYLFGKRTFQTEYEQFTLQSIATGDFFDLPGGTVAGVFGVEYRNDLIKSTPDDVAAQGLLWGYFKDLGANGSADNLELFTEIEVPLVSDMLLFESLALNVSARWTENEVYGAAWTYGVKGNWEVTEWMRFRGTVGTSFRAPNLNELFLGGQSGFLGGENDPCVDPTTYGQPDTRSANVIANCTTHIGNAFLPLGSSIEVFNAGAEVVPGGNTLSEEKSRTWTLGTVLEQPFFDDFELRASATYFDIYVEDAIIFETLTAIFDGCYSVAPASFNPASCMQFSRNPATLNVSSAFLGTVNANSYVSEGADFNVFYGQDVTLFGEPFDLSLDITVTRLFQLFYEDEAGSRTRLLSTFGSFSIASINGAPKWRGESTAIIGWDDFRILWRARYIGRADNPEEWDPGQIGTTCILVPGANCDNVDFVDEYWLHNASLTWDVDDVVQATFGVANVFDEEPPLVDWNEGIQNGGQYPTGFGYDEYGRMVYLNLKAGF